MKIERITVSKINPAPYNPRKDLKPEDQEYKILLKSMDTYGCVVLLVWNKRTGNLVSGHQRLKILLAKGVTEVEVVVVDLSLEDEKALNLALNMISGDWDQDKLAALLEELAQVPDFDVELTGFDLPEIQDILTDSKDEENFEENFDIEKELAANRPVVTKLGDIIELGLHNEHRIICGDVTKQADVRKLMAQFRAQLCNCDPPYNICYDRRNRPTSKLQRDSIDPKEARSMKLQNDDLTPARYNQWFTKVADAINEVLVPGAPYYGMALPISG